jgi:hypothetical protein
MKKLICLGICLFSMSAYAQNEPVSLSGDNACALYDSLSVSAQTEVYGDAMIMEGDLTSLSYCKILSGLSCRMREEKKIVPKRYCDCSFEENLSNEQMADIYISLSAREDFIGGTDVKVFNKIVGTMFFIKKIYQLNIEEYVTNYQFSVFYN